jgi:membrane protease subunit HflC
MKQVLIVRLGDPVRVINRFRPNTDYGQTGAGLAGASRSSNRRCGSTSACSMSTGTPAGHLADQRRLEVDAYARYRVIDPVKMYQTAGTVDRVSEQLQPILNSALRQELGKRTFASLLTAERGAAMAHIRAGLDSEAREYGAQVIDVRIKRADLPDGTPLDALSPA